MSGEVALTGDERATLGAAAWAQFARMSSSNPGDIANALIPAVESIVAARVAEALRHEADPGVGLTHHQWVARLNALANEYDPAARGASA